MSIVLTHSNGWIISHEKLLRTVYQNVRTEDGVRDFNFDEYFNIYSTFKRISQLKTHSNKRKKHDELSDEVTQVKETFESIIATALEHFCYTETGFECNSNNKSRLSANTCFDSFESITTVVGGNCSSYPIVARVQQHNYLFPPSCKFICDDVSSLHRHLNGSKFDLILLDPPWYNRFVKRRKKHHPHHGYSFLDVSELSGIGIEGLLVESGLVAVWTTNSTTHIEAVKKILFPRWGVQYVSTWFWIKVTRSGESIVPFSNDDCKKPYERLMFGCNSGRTWPIPENNKCIVSVPSSVHSHKPPISEVLSSYTPPQSECLEIFARYLLPGWTSCGNQVISLQLQSLYGSKISNTS